MPRKPRARWETPPKVERPKPQPPTLGDVAAGATYNPATGKPVVLGGSPSVQELAQRLIEINPMLKALAADSVEVWQALRDSNAAEKKKWTQMVEGALKQVTLIMALNGSLPAIKYALHNIKHYDGQWTVPNPTDLRLTMGQEGQDGKRQVMIVEIGDSRRGDNSPFIESVESTD